MTAGINVYAPGGFNSGTPANNPAVAAAAGDRERIGDEGSCIVKVVGNRGFLGATQLRRWRSLLRLVAIVLVGPNPAQRSLICHVRGISAARNQGCLRWENRWILQFGWKRTLEGSGIHSIPGIITPNRPKPESEPRTANKRLRSVESLRSGRRGCQNL